MGTTMATTVTMVTMRKEVQRVGIKTMTTMNCRDKYGVIIMHVLHLLLCLRCFLVAVILHLI